MTEHAPNPKPTKIPIVQRLKNIWMISREKQMLLLTPNFATQAITLLLSSAVFPRYYNGTASDIGAIYLCYGFAAFLSALISGKLHDKFGWVIVFIIYNVAFVSVLVLCIFVEMSFGLALVCGFLFGISDTVVNNISNIELTSRWGKGTGACFAWFRFAFCIAYTVLAFPASSIDAKIMFSMGLVMCAISGVCYVYLQKKIPLVKH